MGINVYGLIPGHISAVDVMELIAKNYGGSNYNVTLTGINNMYHVNFTENDGETCRNFSVFTYGNCSNDYQHVTIMPMTLIMCTAFSDAAEIIEKTCVGGYMMDERVSEEYVKL